MHHKAGDTNITTNGLGGVTLFLHCISRTARDVANVYAAAKDHTKSTTLRTGLKHMRISMNCRTET